MESGFWHRRWAEGRIGWHQDAADRRLREYWAQLDVPERARVLVPLCGKSLDMAWLAGHGHRVLGVELSTRACEAYFAEQQLQPTIEADPRFKRYSHGAVEIWAGDVHALNAQDLVDVEAFYDRAALIALPGPMRQTYVESVYSKLPIGSRGLLITLEHPPAQREGPPFPVGEAEVRALFEPQWEVTLIERLDILDDEPRFAAEGVSQLESCTYRLLRRR